MQARSFLEFVAGSASLRDSPWLVIGKGPSFSDLSEVAAGGFVTIGINHVCEEFPVDFLHVMDLDVIGHLGGGLEARTTFLVMPRYPHVSFALAGLKGTFHRVGSRSLDELLADFPVLGELAAQQRLLCYDASSGPGVDARGPVVEVGAFSAATVIELLATAGIRHVRSAGVDGGVAYAGAFARLAGQTRLDAGQSSYDLQFAAIARTVYRHGLDFGPLGTQVPVRIYVGTQAEQELATRVLAHSIRSHASITVDVIALDRAIGESMPDYAGILAGLPQGTPFSLQRFAIPELAGRHGRAIYLDSDMLVFADIRELWNWPIGNGVAAAVQATPHGGRDPQLSVLVIDCARAAWDIRDIAARLRARPDAYGAVLGGADLDGGIERSIPYRWNSLEFHEDGKTCLLHYTNMRHQPWLSWRNPLARWWCAALAQAIEAGAVAPEMVQDHIARGWVRPTLRAQLDAGLHDPLLLDRGSLHAEDKSFLPPHLQPGSAVLRAAAAYGRADSTRLQLEVRRAVARLRYLLWRSGMAGAARRLSVLWAKTRRAILAGRSRGPR